jgi:hypothetical protein
MGHDVISTSLASLRGRLAPGLSPRREAIFETITETNDFKVGLVKTKPLSVLI